MSGKPKLKLYQYSADLKYMRYYESQSEVFEKYYEGKKGDLFSNKEYKELPDGTYVAAYRIGTKKLSYWIRVYNSPYCSKNVTDKSFSAYNYLGEKVASFLNMRVAVALTGLNQGSISNSLLYSKGSTSKLGLIFKYD